MAVDKSIRKVKMLFFRRLKKQHAGELGGLDGPGWRRNPAEEGRRSGRAGTGRLPGRCYIAQAFPGSGNAVGIAEKGARLG